MNKFNLPRRNIQKERRQKRTERRKQKARTATTAKASSSADGNSAALALKVSSTNVHSGYLSGKSRAKLQKKWRRAQKEALESGLVTMHDIEMMAVDEGAGTDGAMQPSRPKSKKKFSMKKRAKLRLKSSSSQGQVSEPVAVSRVDGEDAMMQ